MKSIRLLFPLVAVLGNLTIAYIVYFVARMAFLAENWSFFSDNLSWNYFTELLKGGIVFDTTAILYTNVLWVVMMFLPVSRKENPHYHSFCKWLFVGVNLLALVVNLADSVYFQYTLRRTTTTVFQEFSNENNLGGIFGKEALSHWYFFVLAAFIGWVMHRLYLKPKLDHRQLNWKAYAAVTMVSLLAFAPFCVAGMRGGWTTAVRPITISNAHQYVERPTDAALVLNTPFSLIRTVGKNVFSVPDYFADAQEMESIFTPIHNDSPSSNLVSLSSKKNVVILIVESFGREYIGALNKDLENGQYKGYTPHVDSLIAKSTTFTHSYCNGRKSIDGMPSILSSIPMFIEPFVLTPSSMNNVTGIAGLLAAEGYQTAFFHGAQRNSMGFQAFARKTGFQDYYGREDYDADTRFGGDDDFDGMWAIWDEPFLQYYATKMSEMKQPFMTAVFTASSHHPYAIPEKYQDVYPEEGLIIYKCIRYTDMAIGKFFEKASHEPWFENTIFVLTSDHTNLSDHAYYETDLGGFCSPIIIYEPGNPDRQPEIQDKIAQQIDILPTVMGMLDYPKPYIAFGIDLFNTPAEDTWAVNYLNGIYQYVKHGHVLQFDGQHTTALYALSDSLMQHNLISNHKVQSSKLKVQSQMELELKAIIQQYMYRMTHDQLMP